ncbi:hypothetical protein O7635_33890 [Asanoa sp. WMMD1127]|uniref:hypothetical protein n=1 Tax=Asanoa sp. WMMD1127 TaxID=3016107 RepID=UPI0024170AA3|nr:hypothetical protein [Asanoa sp. WMMD1127]MDG4826866.1 hypothetical protein [Asanoa sp. WMMD1127]
MSFVVPDACTLPTAAQPLRVAEFRSLFARAAESVERVDGRHLRIRLRGEPGLADAVRDLAARENDCCAFFTFAVTTDDSAVLLDAKVPAAYAEVLDGLARLAEVESA